MGAVVVANWITLDGVMQAPGRADEDTRDDFAEGGWAAPYTDASMGEKMSGYMRGGYAWLFGRRSYEDLLESWNAQGGPFKEALNNTQKYVASSDSTAGLGWPNSTLLHGDVPAKVTELKRHSSRNLIVMGSGVLIESLMAADLIDTYVLMVAPIVLGKGRHLFAAGSRATLGLRECISTSTGAVIATYGPAL